MRFPSDSPASQARLARAIEKERAARMPKTTRGTPFEEHLREMGHPAAKIGAGPTYQPPQGSPKRCPTCNSHSPALHPAVQHGGEVHICPDPWHGPLPDYAKPKEERNPQKLASSGKVREEALPHIQGKTTPQSPPRAQEQAALVPELKAGDLVMWQGVLHQTEWKSYIVVLVLPDGGLRIKNHKGFECNLYPGEWRLPTPAERAQSGVWIEWKAADRDEAPVPDGTRVSVKFRDGGIHSSLFSKHWAWCDTGGSATIVAYKVIQP